MSDSGNYGRYRIIRTLGQGGTATVHLATDGRTEVALKVLHAQLALEPVVRERFRRELEIARRLEHPNIAKVYDLLVEGDRVAAVMEYCPGGSLADRGLVSPIEAETWLRALAGALAKAHAAGVVHRDIKPENILFSASGEPKLCDFGSARVQDLMGLTATTSFLSTPLYLPPEGSRSSAADPRWDLYSLGAVFYKALSGKEHRGTGLADLLASEGKRPPSLVSVAPEVPGRLATLIDALLAPRESRPRHARAIIDHLDGLVLLGEDRAKHCLFCDAPMTVDCPVCLSCGAADLYPREEAGPEAETVVLDKVPEDAGAMARLYAFMKAWAGSEVARVRFITEDARMYSKAEREGTVRLPVPLIANLDAETAETVANLVGGLGAKSVHATRMKATKARRKFRKREPLLPTRRPWPEPTDPAFFGRHQLALEERATDLPALFPGSSEADGGARLYGNLLLDAFRLAERFRSGGPATADLADLVDRLVESFRSSAEALGRIEDELAAINPGSLYLESQRIRALLAQAEEGSGRRREELLARERRNRETSERQERASLEYGRALNRLLESGASLKRLLASIERGARRDEIEEALRELEGD